MKHKKYHLIYFFSLLFFILSLVSTTTAQTSYLDSLDGKYALQFQISENFTLSDFQGSILSGKYHFGKRSAVRLGLAITFEDGNADRDYIIVDSVQYSQNVESNSFGITINSQYINYLVNADEIGCYIGAGPTLNFSTSESQYESSDSTNEDGNASGEYYNIGIDAMIGVEWCFHERMTLSAEYGLKFYYHHRNEKYNSSIRMDERTSKSFRLTANYVNFGISVYF
jgi:opacity protein-like surface antigen